MQKFIVTLSVVIFFSLLFSCKSQQSKMIDLGENIGAPVTAKSPTDVKSLVAALEKQDTVHTQLKAKVDGVCQVKGCWMNLIPTTGEKDPAFFVKFKDYAFFMPLDLTGDVIVQGKAYKEITPVDELRHYAEDEGKSPEEIAKITEPAEELKFMADGVILLK